MKKIVILAFIESFLISNLFATTQGIDDNATNKEVNNLISQVAPKTKGEAVPLVDVLNENEATPKKVTEKVQQDEELIVEPDVKVPLENSTIDTIAQNNTEPSLDSADMKSKPLATEQVQIEGENTKKPTEKKRTIRKTAVKNEEPLSSKEDTSQPND